MDQNDRFEDRARETGRPNAARPQKAAAKLVLVQRGSFAAALSRVSTPKLSRHSETPSDFASFMALNLPCIIVLVLYLGRISHTNVVAEPDYIKDESL